jgi:hypothetical protein
MKHSLLGYDSPAAPAVAYFDAGIVDAYVSWCQWGFGRAFAGLYREIGEWYLR